MLRFEAARAGDMDAVLRWWRMKCANWPSDGTSTKEIAAMIHGIQEEIREAVGAMNEGTQQFETRNEGHGTSGRIF